MKKIDKTECVIWLLALAPLIVTASVYPHLPVQIPTHWGINGTIDAYSPKAMAWAFPAIALGLTALMKWIPSIDPRRDSYEKFSGAYKAFRLVLSLFFALLCAAMLYAAFAPEKLPMDRIVTVCVGALFCVLGNYMPKFRHNYFCGVRTPWTLANEAVWIRTHRLAGVIWFASGLAMVAAALLLPSHNAANASFVLMVLVLVAATACALVPTIYSYILYKKTQKPPND